MKTFNLLQGINEATIIRERECQCIRANFAVLAADHSIDQEQLVESVIDVLVNIAATASAGKPIKAMNVDSVSAFFAGVDRMSKALPSAQSPNKENMLRALTAAGIGDDGLINTAVAPIAQYGVKDEALRQKYAELIKAYVASAGTGHPDGSEIVAAARRLQVAIHVAMKTASAEVPVPPQANSMRARLS